MAFRYINPGYVVGLNTSSEATQVVGFNYSDTGVAFSQIASYGGILISDFNQGDDFWAKFDCYIPENISSEFYCLIPFSSTASGISVMIPAGAENIHYIYAVRGAAYYTMISGTAKYLNIKRGGINTFTFHAVYDLTFKYSSESNSLIEVFFNGNKFISLPGNGFYYRSDGANYVRLYGDNSVFFSNIILSNEEISPKEQIIALTADTTFTDMTAGENGIYVADAANQSLLQTVDIDELIATYGASSAVTGISLIGNPAYKTATGLAALTGISKSSDIVIAHDTINLSDDTNSMIMDSWGLSGVTIADLEDMQFGWKVKE